MTVELMRMFPLGNVLFPHTLIPLRVFEPRYLQMIAECEAHSAPFGVVLIERGFEVGGGDARFSVGTSAVILDTADLTEGHRAVVAAGTERIEVTEWLPDDPYPAALVHRITEEPNGDVEPAEIADTNALLRRALTLSSEMGRDMGALQYELSSDSTTAIYQMAGLAPLGALDAQKLLEAPNSNQRHRMLRNALEEETELLRARLGGA